MALAKKLLARRLPVQLYDLVVEYAFPSGNSFSSPEIDCAYPPSRLADVGHRLIFPTQAGNQRSLHHCSSSMSQREFNRQTSQAYDGSRVREYAGWFWCPRKKPPHDEVCNKSNALGLLFCLRHARDFNWHLSVPQARTTHDVKEQ